MTKEWYEQAMQEADDEDKDFLGCPSCLGGDIEKVSDVINSFGHRAISLKCNDCGQRWEEVEMPDFKGD